MKNTTTLLTMAVLLSACAGQADLPMVTTDEVTAITYNSATVNATVTDDGGAPIEARGVCYSTSPQPSLDNGTCTSNDRGTGTFSAEINNLSTNTTYYTRAYATNSEGTGYGNDIEYVTQINGSGGTPQIISGPITDITYTTVSCQGSVSGFGSPIQMKGICWSTQPNPTINDNYQQAGSGEGDFTLTMEGLDAGTSYYVKTYCLVNADTLYGNEVEFYTVATPEPIFFLSYEETCFQHNLNPITVIWSPDSCGSTCLNFMNFPLPATVPILDVGDTTCITATNLDTIPYPLFVELDAYSTSAVNPYEINNVSIDYSVNFSWPMGINQELNIQAQGFISVDTLRLNVTYNGICGTATCVVSGATD